MKEAGGVGEVFDKCGKSEGFSERSGFLANELSGIDAAAEIAAECA